MSQQPQYAHEPGHPDYDQYMSLRSKFEKMHGENGIDGPNLNHNATSAALRSFKAELARENSSLDPKSGIDGVVLSRANDRNSDIDGKYAILYQGDPNSPTVRTHAIPTHELTQPAEQNLQDINRMNDQRQQQTQSQERQQSYQTTQEQERQSMGTRSLI
ncbi:MAG: XVIPCD domain-containing protein [Lysobacteraceae bacterium]